jgi:hypothetical protein
MEQVPKQKYQKKQVYNQVFIKKISLQSLINQGTPYFKRLRKA